MKLLQSNKSKTTKDKNSENVPNLEITERNYGNSISPLQYC